MQDRMQPPHMHGLPRPTHEMERFQQHQFQNQWQSQLAWIQGQLDAMPNDIVGKIDAKVENIRGDTNMNLDRIARRLEAIELQLASLSQQRQQCMTCGNALLHAQGQMAAAAAAAAAAAGPQIKMQNMNGARLGGARRATKREPKQPRQAPATRVVARPARPRTQPTSIDADSTIFMWSDGTQHYVPENWKFPQTTCLDMWDLWFHGDEAEDGSRVGPYRKIRGVDILEPYSKRGLYVARRVMKFLVDTAISKGFAASEEAIAELQETDLRNVYRQTFEHMASNAELYLSKRVDSEKWATASYMVVYDALEKGRRAEKHEFTFTWSDGSLRLTPENWRLPTANCSAMWQLWFRGDPAAGIGPFRHLKEGDVENRQDLYRARTAMNKLVELAVEQGIVTSPDDLTALTDAELETAFELAFDDFALHDLDNPKGGAVPQDMSVRQFYECLRKRKRSTEADMKVDIKTVTL
ncbi:hypothetical protein AeNC1_009975 [Aphanomyces euteiches]|nr:hypothetical protein AeNC1_009975 [Aphanomyces euteiches]